ncbi:hypothetical protein [Burkholderia diffusa]|uniref:Uncharacterized protein n=1 Tax=Burkholderia diffusa TaxID=488732 RepID=A0A6P2H9B6_9BURK|nr:hypothetical protein [Burkholderia diffusa]KAB0648491.1 hypothetical protein F7R23_30185 [Burkholderia diffusa]MBM2656316.1 hypothetical protein [Burkholderia diffusa]VWB13850.1 hypothetical protein BDI24065_00477 [Burkholderia diffusa]
MGIFDWLKRSPESNIQDARKALGKMFPFPHSFEAMQEVFSQPVDNIALNDLDSIPNVSGMMHLGFNAVLLTRHIEIQAFPRYLSLIRRGWEEVRLLHYQDGNHHMFVSFSDELGGRNVHILTNSAELIVDQAKEEFGPPPPWVVWCYYGPFVRYNEGAEEYWSVYLWRPFWEGLTPDARDAYIERRSKEALSYMSEQEWEDWVYSTRKNDPEYKAREGL